MAGCHVPPVNRLLLELMAIVRCLQRWLLRRLVLTDAFYRIQKAVLVASWCWLTTTWRRNLMFGLYERIVPYMFVMQVTGDLANRVGNCPVHNLAIIWALNFASSSTISYCMMQMLLSMESMKLKNVFAWNVIEAKENLSKYPQQNNTNYSLLGTWTAVMHDIWRDIDVSGLRFNHGL